MQEILTQRFHFARIIPYKDYCKIEEKLKLKRAINDNIESYDIDEDLESSKKSIEFLSLESNKKIGRITRLPDNKKKGKIFYFSSNDDVKENFTIQYAYPNPKTQNIFETKKDNQIKRHYGRPFSSIEICTIERRIKIENNKLTVRLYQGSKTRGFNCIHFKKSYFVHSITLDLTNGNFTVAKITKSGKTSTKIFRKNSFTELYNILKGKGVLSVNNQLISKKSELYNEFEKTFNNKIFIEKLRENLDVKYDNIPNQDMLNLIFLDYVKYFIKLKKIKVPNGEYIYWLKNFYPTEKFLKKNDRKLIASILDMIDLKSKITIKILHEYPNIDLVNFKWICDFFGDDYSKYISNIKIEVFEDSNKKTRVEDINKFHILNRINRALIIYTLSDTDKENLIKIINSTNYSNNDVFSSRFVNLMDDHLSMIQRLRQYLPEIYMRAKTYDDFHNEHRELTMMISSIKKGWVVEYKFTEKLINEIEQPIEIKQNIGTKENPVWSTDTTEKNYLYPHILKREEDYDEEGTFMHHCVATYSNKEKSIIVSIRNKNGSDRVTCEYDIQTGHCVQERYYCNGIPPEEFDYSLYKMREMIKRHSNYGTLNWIEKTRVPVKINGVEIKPEDREPRRLGDVLYDYDF